MPTYIGKTRSNVLRIIYMERFFQERKSLTMKGNPSQIQTIQSYSKLRKEICLACGCSFPNTLIFGLSQAVLPLKLLTSQNFTPFYFILRRKVYILVCMCVYTLFFSSLFYPLYFYPNHRLSKLRLFQQKILYNDSFWHFLMFAT